jgi:hypothetical protein
MNSKEQEMLRKHKQRSENGFNAKMVLMHFKNMLLNKNPQLLWRPICYQNFELLPSSPTIDRPKNSMIPNLC